MILVFFGSGAALVSMEELATKNATPQKKYRNKKKTQEIHETKIAPENQ